MEGQTDNIRRFFLLKKKNTKKDKKQIMYNILNNGGRIQRTYANANLKLPYIG